MKYRVVQMSDGKYRIEWKYFLFWSAYSGIHYEIRSKAIEMAKNLMEWEKEKEEAKKTKRIRVIEEIEG